MKEITVVGDAYKKAQEKKAKELASQDPFAISPVEEIVFEDLDKAKECAQNAIAQATETAAKAAGFAKDIFPTMASLVEKREESRGVSDGNVRKANDLITLYLNRPAPAGNIAKTAYMMATVRAEGGVVDSERLVDDFLERKLVKPDPNGPISRGKYRYSLNFAPMEEHRAILLQAVRERFGEAERAARQEYGQTVKALLATSQMTIWELLDGKKGKFAYRRPFEILKGKGRKDEKTGVRGDMVYKSGFIAGESDGQRISFSTGLGGCEKIVSNCHEAGLTLAVKMLNDSEFWTRKEELRPLIAVHRTLWSIRRHLEVQGQGPVAEKAVAELVGRGQVKPETFFSDDKPRETLIVFEGEWRLYNKDGVMRDRDKRYNPVYNMAVVLARKDGQVFWKKTVSHLEAIFKDAIGKPLEAKKGEKTVFGVPAALYRWAKRKYAPKSSEESEET